MFACVSRCFCVCVCTGRGVCVCVCGGEIPASVEAEEEVISSCRTRQMVEYTIYVGVRGQLFEY